MRIDRITTNMVEQTTNGKTIMGRLLLVDDDTGLLELLKIFLESIGHQVEAHSSPADAIKALHSREFDLVISDLRMGPIDGMSMLNTAQTVDPTLPVIILTAHGCIPSAVEAMRSGAYHYLTKPFANKELQNLVNAALEYRTMACETTSLRQAVEHHSNHGFIYKSPVTDKLVEDITRFARSDANVFLTGESGTGKELAASSLHSLSDRADKPFLAINCGAIPESLLESELFGHVKGAFTGASSFQEGFFSRASSGTILLDEVGDLPLSLQVKLLRVLQEQHIRPVGASKEIPIDVRVISATHRDIPAMIAEGEFREDLYYRLHVIPIHIPPLRERREDIPLLAQYFLDKAAERLGKEVRGITRAAMEELITRPWPGNVRELQNVMEYVAAAADEGWIDTEAIPDPLRASGKDGHLPPLVEARAQFENDYLEHLMRATSGNVAQAARIAGRYRADMYKLLRKYSIHPADFKESAN